LNEKNIPNAIYYPVPLHHQRAYKNTKYDENDFKVTNQLVGSVISLPMHTELETEQQDHVIHTILKFLNT
jgi:UDP-2-acetamido-2-deoxy-ribo-hexuluronate aminotransferase